MDRFRQECALLESIKHPNIVQYLSTTMDPESRPPCPVLLMELLDENLTKMLERSQQSLPYFVQVDICHDVALAVAYLHSNNIIHRDLSSNNVLIIAGRRAKVTDFGMSKLGGVASTMTPLTMCPGNQAYMPPEALREPSLYTKKLDCFSEGVMMTQVYTRLWPDPGPRTQTIQYSKSPMGIVEMPVPETERRKNHIDLIDPTHPILPIAVDCLCFQEMERPSSEELCQRLADLNESIEYMQSIEQQQDEIQAKDKLISTLTQQLRQSDCPGVIHEKQVEIDKKNTLLEQQQKEIASRERQLRQLNQHLEEQELATAEIQQTNRSLQRQVEQLQQQLSQQNHQRQPQFPTQTRIHFNENQLKEDHSSKQLPEQPSMQFRKSHPTNTSMLTLNWRDGCKAPFCMSSGAAVVDGNVAYFMSWKGRGCSYNLTNKRWRKFPEYPYEQCSLAVINSQLTAIGGTTYVLFGEETNQLLSLRGDENWEEMFPPMPTKRCQTMAITSIEHLVVAGGQSLESTKTVEVMDTKTLVWSTVASLPHPYHFASATICGSHLYLLGGLDDKGKTKSVLTCSLTELLQSSSSSSSVWHRVADVPAYHSTCAAVNGQLLAVGGCNERSKPMTATYKYNPTTKFWDQASDMPTARYDCLVVVLPTKEMMVVGGCDGGSDLKTAEFANFYKESET